MSPVIVTFSGPIGSGKSSLSQAVATRLGFSRVSFGDYVRLMGERRGVPQTRESLQKVGVSLIEAGWEEFCKSVLSQACWKVGQSLVVDGVRHVEAFESIQRITSPSLVVLVFVRLSESKRMFRLEQTGIPNAPLSKWDSHPTEIQVATALPEMADLSIDGSVPIKEGVDKVERLVRRLRCKPS